MAALGYRAIAPDLGGMGLSDKPSELGDCSVARHVAWMRSLLVDELDLTDATFVLHDWGLIIGLRVLAEAPERVARVVGSNPGFPVRDPALALPTRPDNPMLADSFAALPVLEAFDRPFPTIFSDRDIVAPKGYEFLHERIPGTAGQPHVVLEGGGHFLQEDVSPAYNEVLCTWQEATA